MARHARPFGRERLARTLVVAGAVAAVGAVAFAPTSGAALGSPARLATLWFSPVTASVPDASHGGTWTAVSCFTAWACVEVGTDADGRGAVAAGVESLGRWRWSSTTTLPTDATGVGRYDGVSCPTAEHCVAVGTDGDGQSIVSVGTSHRGRWRWSGARLLGPDSTGGGGLAAVSCASDERCVAVGSDDDDDGIAAVGRASVAVGAWSTDVPVRSDSAGGGALSGVSCPTSASCVAVGSDDDDRPVAVVATAGGGGWSWSRDAVVGSVGSHGRALSSVACPSPTSCVAVGSTATSQAIEAVGHGAGGAWRWTTTHEVAPDSTGSGGLVAVSCATPTTCLALGTDAGGRGTYASGWPSRGGWTWSVVSPIAARVGTTVALAAVDCASAVSCVTVGGDAASQAVSATSLGSPASPREVDVARGNAQMTISWRVPAFDGGARIGSYRVLVRSGVPGCTARALGTTGSCVVRHLVNGTPYEFAVVADNGAGVSAPSPWTTPLAPSPYGPPVPSPFTPAVTRFLASRSGVVAACVFDVRTGQTWSILPASSQHTASIVKVDILAALLYQHQRDREPLSAADAQLATAMIEDSDNTAAQALYVEIGQAPGLAAFNSVVGLTGTVANYAWGYTDTVAPDQVRLIGLFALPNPVLTTASRRYGLGLLTHVTPAQAWGVSAGPPRGVAIAIKNGWYPTAPAAWQVNSIGWIDGHGRNYLIAVLTRGDATMGYGVETIEGLSTLVWEHLAPVSASVPAP